MFKFDSATSPRKIHEVLSELVGSEAAQSFWKNYRDKYITRDDIRFIKRAGLNSVRVPFNWRLFTTDDYADVWAGPGFEMLDRILAWCSEENLWVVLDMHCAPGDKRETISMTAGAIRSCSKVHIVNGGQSICGKKLPIVTRTSAFS